MPNPSSFPFLSIIPSWDLFAVIALIVGFFIYGWVAGKNRLFAILLSTYFSYVVVTAIPWKSLTFLAVKASTLPNYQIFAFLAIILALLFTLPQSAFGSSLRLHKRLASRWYEVVIFSVLQITLSVAIILSFLTSKMVLDLNPLLRKYFIGDELKFLWLTIPIIALMLVGRNEYD